MAKTKVYIDGQAGTTGLQIFDRIGSREDLELMRIDEDKRHDNEERRKFLNAADIVFLCLPDDGAREAVSLIDNPNVTVIDASTAHRTLPDWAYGFPELSKVHEEKLFSSKRIAVPGCHASGFIALVYPLIEAGLLDKNALITCHSVTGYSGGGKKMIAEYEGEERDFLLDAPRQYALSQSHKHLKEMQAMTGLDTAPMFSPIVGDFYSGMTVTVPLFARQIKGDLETVKSVYKAKYNGDIVQYTDEIGESGFISGNDMHGKDGMKITVKGNEERILLVAAYDNLGKGASGAAVECMNMVLGVDKKTGLEL